MQASLSTRLIAVLILCSALILGSGMWLDYRLTREQILQRLETDAQETIRAALIDMESWLDGVESSTLFLAKVLEQREYSRPGLEQMLRDIVENNDDIYGSTIALNPGLTDSPRGFAPYYFHQDGLLSYADLADETYGYPTKPWFLDAVQAGAPIWAEPYFDRGGGEILMTTYSVPVYRTDEKGEQFLYAVVTADVALDELRGYLRRLRLGQHGSATLLSREGIILSSRNQHYIMRHYSDARSDTVDLPTWQDMFQSVLSGQAVTRQLECPDVVGRCVIRMDTLQSTGWPVGVIYSEHELTEPLREFQLKTAVLGLLTLLLMALAVYLVTRRITRPLGMLASASSHIARGDLDTTLPKVRGQDEVARLVESFNTMRRDLKHYITDLENAAASRSRLEGELAAAREIQMSLLAGGGLASESNERYQLWARVRPAKSVGGDLYAYHPTGTRLYIAVGDVSDKGVPAALFMAKATSLLQQMLVAGDTPARAMARLNDTLEAGNDNCMFVTLFLGVLDLASLNLEFASAGHTAPSLLRDGRVAVLNQDAGPALGLAPGLDFPSNSLTLCEGDRLAVYTDGIDEAFDVSAEMFGTERFNRELTRSAPLSTQAAGVALFEAVDLHAGDTAQSDDITLLLLDILGESTTDIPAATEHHYRLEAGPRLCGRLLDRLQVSLAEQSLPPEILMEVLLIAEELSSNIEKYANLPEGSKVSVTLGISTQQLYLEMSDEGSAFDPLTEAHRSRLGADIESAEIGGLGVHLITQLTDEQRYRRENNCNVLRVVKYLEDAST